MLEKTLESPLDCKEIKPVNPKEINPEYYLEGLTLKLKLNTLATWWEELTHQKNLWYRERLKAGGEGDSRGWNGWMASLIQWTWVWTSSGSWRWTGKHGMLQSMGSEKVGHGWPTDLNWSEAKVIRLPDGSVVKNSPAMKKIQKTWVQSVGWEDPLEEGMATHSIILARRILWTEEPGGLQSMWLQRAGHNWSDWARAKATTISWYLLYWRHVPTAMGTKKYCLISKRVGKTPQNNSFNI